MSEAIIGVIGTIIGTIIGFTLSEIAARRREKRMERNQISAVRALLNHEINMNLDLLDDFWKKLNLSHNKDTFNQTFENLTGSGTVSKMKEQPLPEWSHKMWESQIALLAIALNEEEIKKIHKLHDQLEILKSLHMKFSNFNIEDDDTGHKNIEILKQFKKIADRVLENGNPLQIKMQK